MAAQILATIIFLIMFGFIITEKAPRHLVTLVCAAATLLLVFGVCMRSVSAVWETLNLECFLHGSFWYSAEASESGGINWETIFFISGMMIMVEGMAESGLVSIRVLLVYAFVQCCDSITLSLAKRKTFCPDRTGDRPRKPCPFGKTYLDTGGLL